MQNNIYLIKNLSPWMINELIVFSRFARFNLLLLRQPDINYSKYLEELKENYIDIYIRPFDNKITLKKLKTVISFVFLNTSKLSLNYNGVLLLKSIIWFLRMDLSVFSAKSNIHAQFATQAAIISLLVKKYFNNELNYFFTFHAHDIYFKNKWFEALVNQSSKAFSISEYNMEYVRKSYPNTDMDKIILSRLGTFLPAVSNETFANKNKEITLGFLSWFVKKKGILYLLEAIRLIKDRGLHVRLVLAGDGPLKEKVLKYISTYKLRDTVYYVGKIYGTEKAEFYRSIDVFILPSVKVPNDMDGIPVVLMEAISYGLPIISTKVSGIPEICINEYNGLLIEEKSANQLAEAIEKMLKNEHLMLEYSKNSLVISKKYDIENNSYNKLFALGWIES